MAPITTVTEGTRLRRPDEWLAGALSDNPLDDFISKNGVGTEVDTGVRGGVIDGEITVVVARFVMDEDGDI